MNMKVGVHVSGIPGAKSSGTLECQEQQVVSRKATGNWCCACASNFCGRIYASGLNLGMADG